MIVCWLLAEIPRPVVDEAKRLSEMLEEEDEEEEDEDEDEEGKINRF